MISLDSSILDVGAARARHLDYAARIGNLTVVSYAPRHAALRPATLSPHLSVIPTNSRAKITFPFDAYLCARAVAWSQPVDVITTQDPFSTGIVGLMFKRRFGVPLHVQNHSTFFDNPHYLRQRFRNRVLNQAGKYVILHADTCRVTNRHEKEKYIELGITPARIYCIPVPVDLDRFFAPTAEADIAALRGALGLQAADQVALWVGRPVEAKNLPMLYEAVRLARQSIPNLKLLLVGDFAASVYARALQEQGRRLLGDALIFAGRVDHAALPAYYALSTAYVHSSHYEGMPRVLAEAAASARPMICTDIPGAEAAIVDGETGYLARPADPADFADKIAHLFADPRRAARMGQQARARARRVFDRETLTRDIIGAWRETVALRKER